MLFILCDNKDNSVFYGCSVSLQYVLQKNNIESRIITLREFKVNRNKYKIKNILTFPHLYRFIKNFNCKYIIYNTECIKLYDFDEMLKNAIFILDYTKKNMGRYENHYYLPHIYKFNDIPHKEKTIDILFYGATDPDRHRRRYEIKNKLETKFENITWLQRFKDEPEKHDYISKSKIILDIFAYGEDKCMDWFRIIELIQNKHFFIHETTDNEEEYEKYKDIIVFSDYDKILDTCEYYLNNPEKRKEKTELIFNHFQDDNIEKYFNKEWFKEMI